MIFSHALTPMDHLHVHVMLDSFWMLIISLVKIAMNVRIPNAIWKEVDATI